MRTHLSRRQSALVGLSLSTLLVGPLAFAQVEKASDAPSNAPPLAPFTGPAGNRVLPVPSQLAGLNFAEPGSEESSAIEQSALQLQSQAVVETAGKRAQKLNEVPMTVSWIPAEELEGTGQFTLCDAIQYFPGMECRRGAMRKVGISARGLGSNFLSNRLLLLQDGRPQTDPWTGQFYGDETLPLSNVKQIEVIRGPGSSLYGSNAFSGVINIIRRNPEDLMHDGRDYGADVRILGGQHNTVRAQATAAGRVGDVEALVNYYGLRSDGAELLNDPQRGIVDDNEWSRTHQVSGKVLISDSFTLDAEYTNAGLGRPGGKHISAVGNCGRCHYTADDEENVETLSASAQFDRKLNDHIRVFGQGYTLFKRRTVELKNMVTQEMQPSLGKRNRMGAEVRTLISAGPVTFTLGGDFKRDTVNNQNVLPELSGTDLSADIFGGFVDAELRPFEKLVFSAGARYDYYQVPSSIWRANESQISPRASIVFHLLPSVTLRTNYGRAFRAPTFAELAINQQMYAATLLGNPDLKAETLDTFEAAVDVWPAGGEFRLTVNGFYNNAKNFINEVYLGGSSSQFANVGDARVAGVEVEAAAQIKKINSSFDVAYQYLDAVSLDASGNRSPLDYAPNHRVYLRGRTNFSEYAFAEIFGVWVGERYDAAHTLDPATGESTGRVSLPAYLSANARVGANVTKGVTVSLLGSNIFNSQHEESHGFPVQPLSVFAELKYTH